jgi:hypothetical protein
MFGLLRRVYWTSAVRLLPTADMAGTLESGDVVEVRITEVDAERKRYVGRIMIGGRRGIGWWLTAAMSWSCCSITVSNQPLLRGKRSRFLMNKADDEGLAKMARAAGLYSGELPLIDNTPDNDEDWEAAFSYQSFEGGMGEEVGGWGASRREMGVRGRAGH